MALCRKARSRNRIGALAGTGSLGIGAVVENQVSCVPTGPEFGVALIPPFKLRMVTWGHSPESPWM